MSAWAALVLVLAGLVVVPLSRDLERADARRRTRDRLRKARQARRDRQTAAEAFAELSAAWDELARQIGEQLAPLMAQLGRVVDDVAKAMERNLGPR